MENNNACTELDFYPIPLDEENLSLVERFNSQRINRNISTSLHPLEFALLIGKAVLLEKPKMTVWEYESILSLLEEARKHL